MLVYCVEQNKVYMLVVNASNIKKDWDWIQEFNQGKVEMHNISDKTCLLAIQGPNATKVLQPLTEIGHPQHEVLYIFKRQICRC